MYSEFTSIPKKSASNDYLFPVVRRDDTSEHLGHSDLYFNDSFSEL